MAHLWEACAYFVPILAVDVICPAHSCIYQGHSVISSGCLCAGRGTCMLLARSAQSNTAIKQEIDLAVPHIQFIACNCHNVLLQSNRLSPCHGIKLQTTVRISCLEISPVIMTKDSIHGKGCSFLHGPKGELEAARENRRIPQCRPQSRACTAQSQTREMCRSKWRKLPSSLHPS